MATATFQPLVTTNAITATGTYILTKAPELNQTMVQFSGTYTTASLTFQGSYDGTTFFNLGSLDLNNNTWGTGGTTITLTDSTVRGFMLPSQGMAALQVTTTGPATGSLACFFNNGSFTANPFLFASLTGSSNQTFTGTTTVNVANANAFDVGPNGATNPTLQVDTSTSSAATGIKVTAAAAAAGLAIAVISSGTDESLTLNAKGAGTLSLQSIATGNVILGDAINLQVGTSTGTKIGTTTSMKLSFWNATPIVQPANTVDYVTMLTNLGLRATGGTAAATFPGALSCTALTATSVAGTGTVALTDNMTITDAKNIILASGTGTLIGTATTQKLAFFNATPSVQQSSTGNQSTTAAGSTTTCFLNTTLTGGTGSTAYTVGDVVHHLKVLGLIAA